MNEKEFLEKMMEILDCENEITMDTVLNDIEEWDSLSFVSFLAMASSTYGKKVLSSDVKAAETIRGLYNLIK